MMLSMMSALAESGAVVSQGNTQVAMSSGLIETVLMMAAVIAVFYFFLIRPQKKKEKSVKNMLDALKPGDRICTIGGLYGTVTAIKDDNVTIALGSQQNKVVIARWAVRSVEDAPLENDVEPEI